MSTSDMNPDEKYKRQTPRYHRATSAGGSPYVSTVYIWLGRGFRSNGLQDRNKLFENLLSFLLKGFCRKLSIGRIAVVSFQCSTQPPQQLEPSWHQSRLKTRATLQFICHRSRGKHWEGPGAQRLTRGFPRRSLVHVSVHFFPIHPMGVILLYYFDRNNCVVGHCIGNKSLKPSYQSCIGRGCHLAKPAGHSDRQ